MEIRIRARLALNEVDNIGSFPKGLKGFYVTLDQAGKDAETKDDGQFALIYRHPHLIREFVVKDIAGRVIPVVNTHAVSSRFAITESGHVLFKGVDEAEGDFEEGDFLVREADAKGFLVTLGRGETPKTIGPGQVPPPGGPTVASGWGLSRGNAVKLLIDHEAFEHAAALMRAMQGTPNQKGSLLLTQLTFSIPPVAQVDPLKESLRAIFKFDPPPPDLSNLPRPARVKDDRPERLLIEAADRNVDVRVILNAVSLPWILKIILGVIVFPFAGSDGIFATGGIMDRFTSADEVRRYFSATRPAIRVQEFTQPLFNFGIMHARLAVFDGLQAMCMGASFTQSYIDTQHHAIDEPRRGGATGLPNHDVGIGIDGPAVGDIHRNVQLLWNNTDAADAMPTLPRNPPPQTGGGDGLCSIQIVRTLTENRFNYKYDLRLMSVDTADGLVKEGRDLVIVALVGTNLHIRIFDVNEKIVVDKAENKLISGETLTTLKKQLNPLPDESGLSKEQKQKIIRDAASIAGHPLPSEGEKGCLEAYLRAIANAQDYIYLENQYFTDKRIGDALVNVMKRRPKLQVIMVLNINPDVWYFFYPLRQRRLITRIRRAIGEDPVQPRQFAVYTRWTHEVDPPRTRIMPVYIHTKVSIVDDVWATVGSANLDNPSMDRAYEVNALLLNGVDGEPKSEIVETLRRKLWAEHLGLLDAQGNINPGAPELNARPADGWLDLWRKRSDATLAQLRTQPSKSTKGMARVLPWPKDNSTHKEPRDYITALDIKSYAVAPIKGTRGFDFKQGNYKPGSKAAMDFG